jgi:hypothetical protein
MLPRNRDELIRVAMYIKKTSETILGRTLNVKKLQIVQPTAKHLTNRFSPTIPILCRRKIIYNTKSRVKPPSTWDKQA